MKLADAYKVFGLSEGATRRRVREAKKALLRQWHPDRHSRASVNKRRQADERTKEINAAYEVIEKAGYAAPVPAPTSPAKKKLTARLTPARTPLAIYRLKPSADPLDKFAGALELDDYQDAVRVAVRFPPAEIQDFEVQLVVRHSEPELPAWSIFLNGIAATLPDHLTPTAANSAVLLAVFSKTRYAIAFGYGRALLTPAAIERNFGLKVALALIAPAAMTSVGFKEVDQTTFFSSRQSNQRVKFGDFRVDTTSAILGGVAGMADCPEDYCTKAAGTDALHINPAIRIDELPSLLSWLENVRTSARYKRRGFGWIDEISVVRDPTKIQELRAILDLDLVSGSGELFVGPPEALDPVRVSGFSVVGLRGRKLDEVSLDDIRQARKGSVLSSDILDETRVIAFDEANKIIQRWPALDWLVWSHQNENKTYFLQAGVFYEVERSLEKKLDTFIRNYVRDVPSSWPDWPREDGEDEEVYNDLLTASIGSTAAKLDKNLLRVHFSGRGALEVCDVLVSGSPLKFVAVKKFAGPASVSHVVTQSLNGITSILDDRDLRDELADKVGRRYRLKAALHDLSPETAAIYVLLLTKEQRRPIADFPFFSKLTIVRTITAARSRGLEMFIGTRQMVTTPGSKPSAKRGRKA